MNKILKIVHFIATASLAQILTASIQPNLTKNQDYENETDLCIIPNQEWRITEVSLSVSQVHLYTRPEDVICNILSCIMDKCTDYPILLYR